MSKAYGYIRVSKEEQVDSGLSLEHQEQVATGFWDHVLKDKDIQWGAFWADEAVSAFKTPLLRRPGGEEFVTVAMPGDHVIVTRFDRCFRSMLDFCNTFQVLESRGILLHILDAPGDPGSANGRAMLQMLCVFAEWESRLKSERVKAALAILRQQGKSTGCVQRWGYKAVGPKGQRLIRPDWEERKLMVTVP